MDGAVRVIGEITHSLRYSAAWCKVFRFELVPVTANDGLPHFQRPDPPGNLVKPHTRIIKYNTRGHEIPMNQTKGVHVNLYA
jgi:hypothetical protein